MVSTHPHGMCFYFLSALLVTTLHLTVHACVCVHGCGLTRVLGTEDGAICFLSFEFVLSDMAIFKDPTPTQNHTTVRALTYLLF